MSIRQFSLIDALDAHNIDYHHEDNFNYHSGMGSADSRGLAEISVGVFTSESGAIQVIYEKGRFISIKEISVLVNEKSLALNRKFVPKVTLPVGNTIEIQPLLPEQNIKTFFDDRLLSYKFLIVIDNTKNSKVIVPSESLMKVLEAEPISLTDFEQNKSITKTSGIRVSIDKKEIEDSMSETMAGSLNLTASRQLHEIPRTVQERDLFYPIFPRTAEEIQIMSEADIIYQSDELVRLLDVDFMLCGAYLIKAFGKYPQLHKEGLGLKSIINAVGELETFSIIQEIAKISDERTIANDIADIYHKLAHYLNVASRVCFHVTEQITENSSSIYSIKDGVAMSRETVVLLSRLINFPQLLMIANLTESEYKEYIDHAILNPSTNSLVLADAVLKFNEIDFIVGLLKSRGNLPKYLMTAAKEQYSPFYNGPDHLYPNILYIVSALVSHEGVMNGSTITSNLNLVIGKARQIGIEHKAIIEAQRDIKKAHKERAIKHIGLHTHPETKGHRAIKSLENQFSTTVF